MDFTDKDRQSLIELINNIQHSFFTEQSFREGDSTKIPLPCRLLRSAAEVLGQSYKAEMIESLDDSEIELLVTYLSKALEAVSASVENVVSTLPEKAPAPMLARLKSHLLSLEAIRNERQEIFAAAQSIIEREDEILKEKSELEDLQRRHELLLKAQRELDLVSLEDLRAQVSGLETEIGPSRAELEQLQRRAAEVEQERTAINRALTEARRGLQGLEARPEEQAGLLNLCSDLRAALDPYLERCEKGVQSAMQTITERVEEGRQLAQQLKSRMAEVSKVCEETVQLEAALKLYADTDQRVARSVPTVMSVTRERLFRIEEQLQEIDADLKLAIEQHQSAVHVVDTVVVGG